MSRFFQGSDSDTDSSSSSEEDIYSGQEDDEVHSDGLSDMDDDSDEEEEEASDGEDRGPAARRDYFLRGAASDESDEDEGKRVVKSAKDKRLQEIEATAKAIENGGKINDWTVVANEFEKLNRLVARDTSKQSHKLYIKTLVSLEDLQNEAYEREKAAKKKMNATNNRALNTFRQRIRKNNREYEVDIKKYREDPSAFDTEDEGEAQPVAREVRDEIVGPDGQIRRGFLAAEEDDEGFATVGRGGRATTYTAESIFKHLKAIFDARGKRSTDRGEQIKILEKLRDVAVTPYQKIRVLLALISARFDYSPMAQYMPIEQWTAAQSELMTLLQILEDNSSYVIIENTEDISDEDPPPDPKPGEVVKVRGSLVSFIDRLDDELTKSLQNIDPHTTEYIERLRDEQKLYIVIVRGGIWFERLEKEEYDTGGSASRTVLRRLEHIYYKPASLIENLEKITWENIPSNLDSAISPRSTSAADLVQLLCVYLYKHGQPMLRTRAMLYHIYNFALQNQFHRARDMLLTSHLQETIHQADVGTQICHNRAMVQLGMCAFRLGMITDAQACLQEICGQQRQKELLAQGVQLARYNQQQISPEQEKLERQRQLPFHMHINLELLECIYLVCSMLMEIPAMAQAGNSLDAKKKVISKTFRRFLEYNERQVFVGPPENTRDHVMQASKALSQGDWKKSRSLIEKIRVWDLMGKEESERIKTMLGRKIQEEGVRTYLFTFSTFYDTLSLSSLADMFDMSPNELRRLVTMMISNDEIRGQLDHSDENLVFQRVETTRLQALALALSEKAAGLVEQNQKLMEQKITATSGQGINLDGARKSTTKRDGKDRGERFAAGGNKERRRAPNATEGGERQRRPKQVRVVG